MNKNQHLMIIGAMKCGTSSLFDYLSQHPEISGSSTKEPEYFTQHQSHSVKVSVYDDLWPECTENRIKMEASTGYTKLPKEQGVAQRIKDAELAVKFVYIARNPIERIESHLSYIGNTTTKTPALENYHVAVSNYWLQIQPYLSLFGKDNILVLDFDQLKNDPQSLIDSVTDFLGIAPLCLPDYKVVNKNRRLPYLSKIIRGSRVLRRLYSGLPKGLTSFVKGALVSENATGSLKKIRLSEAEKQQVMAELSEGMLQFGETFSIDVSKWGFNK